MENEDLEQFVRQFSRSQLQILNFIQMLVPSPTEAEDILQETSVVLWKKWSQFDQSRNFVGWACGIARFEVFRHLRNRKHKSYLSEALLEKIGDVALSEMRSREEDQHRQEALAICFESQSSSDQHLLNERYRKEKSVAEIAAQQSVTPRAIYKQMGLVRQMLQRCIERRINEATI